MESTRKFNILLLLIMAVPALYLAWRWPELPERVITHWGFDGRPDRYGPRGSLIAMVALVAIVPNVLMWLVPYIDPKRQISRTQDSFVKIHLLLAAFLSALALVIIHAAARQGIDVMQWMVVLTGLMFAGLGNYLVNVRPNYFLGIRTPWTLESETVWRKTHRLGGRLFFLLGGVLAVFGLVLPDPWLTMLLVLILPAVLIPLAYSYRLYRQEKRNNG